MNFAIASFQILAPAALDAAKSIAARIVKSLGGRGVFGVDLMVRGDEVYFSDITARPFEKIGMEHSPPLSAEAVQVLEQSRRKRKSIGNGWLFLSPEDSSGSQVGSAHRIEPGSLERRRNAPRRVSRSVTAKTPTA